MKDVDGEFEAEVRYFNDIGEPIVKPDNLARHRLRTLSKQEFRKIE